MRWILLFPVLMICLAVPGTGSRAVAEEQPKSKKSKLMAEKLRQSQLLLEGLTTNDLDMVSKAADELLIISRNAEFLAVKTPRYQVYTNSFRESLGEINKKVKAKSLDGATLGYMEMTLTCVRCHEHTREVRDASLPRLLPLGEARTE